jgi:glycosyltransferase involved in cell wall biosynthesis
MHLVYVTCALPFSTEETWIVPEILELKKRGHRITVIPIRPRDKVFHDDARILTTSTIAKSLLSFSVLASALAETVRAPMLVLKSALLLATSRDFRIFLKNVAIFPKSLWLARLAREQAVDHIHAHFASTNATVALVASTVSGIPWSFTAHRWDITENNLLEKKAQTAKFVRAIDARGGQELSAYIGKYQYKVRVIHMGVPVHGPYAKRQDRRPRRPLRVILGARFDERKGHRYALEAIAQLKRDGVDVSLYCAGDGPLKEKIERYSRALNLLDCVHFLGVLDHQTLLTQLGEHRWDVALLPSIEIKDDYEGIPVFLIEAMAAGVPVVATNTGGIRELVGRGAGVLIPQQNAKAIAEALVMLLTNRNLLNQIVEAALRQVRDQFTIESTMSALLEEISS